MGRICMTPQRTRTMQSAVVTGTAGLWNFNSGTANDSSGNGNNGSLNIGAVGRNLGFTAPLTVAAWVKLNSNTTTQSMVERFGNTGIAGNDGGWVLRLHSNGRIIFNICILVKFLGVVLSRDQ